MSTNLANKLKILRKERNIQQEKLATFLNVSVQAVSKWENGNTCPDISLLPDIARFYGITVDELLQVELIDEERLYNEYEAKAESLFKKLRFKEIIPLWQEAYHKMPNSINVKEMLMSAYFDANKHKYQNEIIELGTEIYNSNADAYYKGQAIEQVARTYAENGNLDMAKEWIKKSYHLMHSQEFLNMMILTDGNEFIQNFAFANYWYLDRLFYMAVSLYTCNNIPDKNTYIQSVLKIVAQLYETVYPNDDMSFNALQNLYTLHICIAEDESTFSGDENIIKLHLTRAAECAIKSSTLCEHTLNHPLVYGHKVSSVQDNGLLSIFQNDIQKEVYNKYNNKDWFAKIKEKIS